MMTVTTREREDRMQQPAGRAAGRRTVAFPAVTAFRLPSGPLLASYMSNGERMPNGDPPESTLWGDDIRR